MKIKNATQSNLISIAEIYGYYLGKSTMDLEIKSPEYFETLLITQESSEGLYVIEDNDEVVGWGILKKYSDRLGYAKAGETSVFIHPEKLANGYGKSMKIHLMSEAKNKGYRHLVAKIWANNIVSIQYNLKFGYTIVGTQNKIGFVNGKWVDVVIMQYVFPD
tara:strand:- start:1478 stop:1963 length:486 start_codon:yes stop_codon:yes gene_type:complete